MAITSSSATFTRFFAPDLEVDDFWSLVDEKLRGGAFTEPDDSQIEAAGFASWEDFFDSNFSYGSYRKGEYVAFNFRLDQKKVPGMVLNTVRETIGAKIPRRAQRQVAEPDRKAANPGKHAGVPAKPRIPSAMLIRGGLEPRAQLDDSRNCEQPR